MGNLTHKKVRKGIYKPMYTKEKKRKKKKNQI